MTRLAFAGDRQVAVDCLRFLLDNDVEPLALLVPSAKRASHATALQDMSGLAAEFVLRGTEFREPAGIELLQSLDLDYIIGVHFPYVVPGAVLEVPRIGVTNLHPALLPFNRGWHTPSWAILDQTPIGATLHFMDEGLDTGDIVAQVELPIEPDDTADRLYHRLLRLEVKLFAEAWPLLASGDPPRTPQPGDVGTRHDRSELGSDTVQRLDLAETTEVGKLIRRLRALTTNDLAEAAYFEADGRRYMVQIEITPDQEDERPV
ncbi:MAG: formyltransferase family protein [Acidimicrobiia bacterium]